MGCWVLTHYNPKIGSGISLFHATTNHNPAADDGVLPSLTSVGCCDVSLSQRLDWYGDGVVVCGDLALVAALCTANRSDLLDDFAFSSKIERCFVVLWLPRLSTLNQGR